MFKRRIALLIGCAWLASTFCTKSTDAQDLPPRFKVAASFPYERLGVPGTGSQFKYDYNQFFFGSRFTWNLNNHLGLEAEFGASPFDSGLSTFFQGGRVTLFGAQSTASVGVDLGCLQSYGLDSNTFPPRQKM